MRSPSSRFSSFALLFLTLSACSRAGGGGMTVQPTELSYLSHGDTLVATLLLPAGKGPFPGAVIVHGSGSSDRRNPWTQAYVEALVQRGIAVLYPDKRGSGNSQGDWHAATFELLADDALAGFEQLLGVPKVDPERAGLIGFSQGGDIVPLTATRSTRVRFAIDVSGSVVPLLEQIGDEIRQAGLQEGLHEEQLQSLQEIHRLGSRYALNGDGWQDYREALRAAQTGLLKGSAVLGEFPQTPDSAAWTFARAVGNFDPYRTGSNGSGSPPLGRQGSERRGTRERRDHRADLQRQTLQPRRLALRERTITHCCDDAMDFIARWIRDKGID